jgi:hypothetical protein
MDSKLEYWFLLTKRAVVVLDEMIEDVVCIVVSALDNSWWISCGMLVMGSVFYLPSQTRQFSQVQFPMRGWILDFPIHQKSLPIALNSSNRKSFI